MSLLTLCQSVTGDTPNNGGYNNIVYLLKRILALKGSNRKGGEKGNLIHSQSKKKPAGAGLLIRPQPFGRCA